jgi:hypothetical protein
MGLMGRSHIRWDFGILGFWVVEYKLFSIGVDGFMNSSKNRQYRREIALQKQKDLAIQPRKSKVLKSREPKRKVFVCF